MKSRAEIKALAKETMGKQRGTSILIVLVMGALYIPVIILAMVALIVSMASGLFVLGWALYIAVLLLGPLIIYIMMVNGAGEYVKIYRQQPANLGTLFTGLGVNFWRKLGGLLWMNLWLLIWTLPAIAVYVIGLVGPWLTGQSFWLSLTPLALPLYIFVYIKWLSYSMTLFILADSPHVKATQALKLSKQITNGHKGKLFVLQLSFIGWLMLSGLTYYILYIVYVGPYMYTTYAGFYEELRKNAMEEGRVSRWDLDKGEDGTDRGRGFGIGIDS